MMYVLPAACLLFCAGIAGCRSVQPEDDLFDDNERIAREGDTYSYIWETHEVSACELDLTFGGFYGKHSIWRIDSTVSSELSLDIAVSRGLNGRFKLCLVQPQAGVLTIASGEGDFGKTVPIEPGTQYLVLVGHGASGHLSLRLNAPGVPEGYTVREIM